MPRYSRKILAALLIGMFLLLISGLSPQAAVAHRINVFCWVEKEKVQCESNFSADSPVKNATMKVYARQTGQELLAGKTSESGKFSFPVPKNAQKKAWDLKVVCEAGMGHENFWIVRAEEITGDQAENSSEGKDEISLEQQPAYAQKPGPKENADTMHISKLEKVVSNVLKQELTPIKRDLKMLQQRPVNFQDILGGLGYIIGLMGIIFYFKSRERQ